QQVEYLDGPDDTGEMFDRPGKLSDYLRSPYKNENEARYANNGGLPPDLSLITKARHGNSDYLFAMLVGYQPPTLSFCALPYTPNSKNGFEPLYDGSVEFEDGTPATASQMAKDVTTFLQWSSEPEQDERKLVGAKLV
ncbi:cytochrome c1, partial [Baffinella frigidus]